MALGGGRQPRRHPGGPAAEVPHRSARAPQLSPMPGRLAPASPMSPLARLRLPQPNQGPSLPPLAGSPVSAAAPTATRVWKLGTARLLQRSAPRASPRRAPPPCSPQPRPTRGTTAPRAKLSLLLLGPPPATQPGWAGHREGSSEPGYYSEKRIWEWVSQVNRSLFAPSGIPGPPERDKSIRMVYQNAGGLPLPSPGIRDCQSRKGRSATPSFNRRGN